MKKKICSIMGVVLFFALLVTNCAKYNIGSLSIGDTLVPMASAEDSFNMTDFNNWKSGDYNYLTGKYTSNSYRICMNNSISVNDGDKLIMHISDKQYHILIRTLDTNGQLISSYNLADGDKITIEENAKSIVVGLYNLSDTKSGMTFDKYKTLFQSGFKGFITKEVSSNSDDPFGMRVYSNWKSGDYNYLTGEYNANSTRLCLSSEKSASCGAIYTVLISDPNYHILIREMSKDGKLIKSHNLANGEKYTVSNNVSTIRVGIYNLADSKSGMTEQKYSQLFSSGFYAYLKKSSVENNTSQSNSIASQNDNSFGMTDFSNWKTGNYSYSDGKYIQDATRICLTDYKVVSAGQTFKAHINNSNYHILVRTLDSSNGKIGSYDLADGMEFKCEPNVAKIGISLYDTKSTTKTFDAYKTLFSNGFKAYLSSDNNITNDTDDVVDESIFGAAPPTVSNNNATDNSSFGMSDFSNWRSGNYSYSDGKYIQDATRICLTDYKSVSAGQTFKAHVSNSNYHILVRTLNSSNGKIGSYDLADGKEFKCESNAVKIGISIYDTKSATKTFDAYKALFNNGFKASLETITDNSKVENVEQSNSLNNKVSYTDVKSEMIAMIQAGDKTEHDVSNYKMKWLDVNNIFNSVVENECLLEFECADGLWITINRNGDYAKSIKINGFNDKFQDCITKAKARIENIKAGVDKNMTELDIALYCYDNIVVNTKYNNNSASCYYGGNVLAYNTGACTGFSKAYKLVLREIGIDAAIVQSGAMNHEWVMIKLDGQWYHTDPTWDNALYVTYKTPYRNYFLRNSKEFEGGKCVRNHYKWTVVGGYTSTSTKYSDWFVHDVTGTMTYENGYWLYTDKKTGHSMKAKLDGSDIIDLSK